MAFALDLKVGSGAAKRSAGGTLRIDRNWLCELTNLTLSQSHVRAIETAQSGVRGQPNLPVKRVGTRFEVKR